MSTTTVVRLCWDNSPDITLSVKARLFGELVRLAVPKVKHYHSDLFHDAHWISEHVGGPCSFYYCVDSWGTSIGADGDLVGQRGDSLYHLTLTHEDDKFRDPWQWTLEIEEVD